MSFKEGPVGKGKQSKPKAKKETDGTMPLPDRRTVDGWMSGFLNGSRKRNPLTRRRISCMTRRKQRVRSGACNEIVDFAHRHR